MSVMLLLVGEQPAPNLLPLRHYSPTRVALVHTSLPLSRLRAERLAKVIGSAVEKPFCETDAYQVDLIREALTTYIDDRGWPTSDMIFNLTGGTKTMALAAYEVARQFEARAFYYQTEDNQSLIHPYHFERGRLVCEKTIAIQETLTLDEYLRLYAGEYREGRAKNTFEEAIGNALRSHLPGDYEVKTCVSLVELAGNVEIDAIARRGNQVAVFEIKRQADKEGIDQLNGVTDQRTLGTYARKILVSATQVDKNNEHLAQAYRIKVVPLPSGFEAALTDEDAQRLVAAVRESLEPKR